MYPDYLIYDEIKRRDQDAWEPVPLHLPLYMPYLPEEEDRDRDDDKKEERGGVTIIDVNDYTELEL